MTFRWRDIAAFALALTTATCWADESVTLAPGAQQASLAGRISVLRDDGGEWTLDDVRSPERSAQFIPSPQSRFGFGLTTATYWFRFGLRNPGGPGANAEWVLDLQRPVLDLVDVHVVRSDGRVDTVLTGDTRQPPAEQLESRTFAIPLRVAPGEEVSLFVRVRSAGPVQVTFDAWQARAFEDHRARDNFWYGVFFGTLLVMILYNLIIGARLRDRAYLYYVLLLASIVLIGLVQAGYARMYGDLLFEGGGAWLDARWPVINSVGNLCGALFIQAFVPESARFPRIHRLTRGMVWLWWAVLIASPLLSYRIGTAATMFAQVATSLFFLFSAAYLSWKGVRSAQFLLLAWGGFTLALLVYFAASIGLVRLTFVIQYGWQIGITLAITILALALADRINEERTARDTARAASERLRNFLPQRVAELVSGGEAKLLEPKRRNVTVVVIDLRGFTPFAETAAPEDVMRVLRDFYAAMGAIVDRHAGTVEHFAGDSMLIFFNAPLEVAQHEQHAVRAALEMQQAFNGLRDEWKKLGHELGLGIGIADGHATIGAIGFSGRSQYAAIGAVTNLAARLCSTAQHGEILTTRRVLAAVESVVKAESVGEQSIKGFRQPVQVARILAAA